MLLPIFTKSVLIFTKSDVRYVTIEVSCPFETIQLKKSQYGNIPKDAGNICKNLEYSE